MLKTENYTFPDIFLAGAPKAGTTTLFDLLNTHSAIQGAVNKEPAFYMDKSSPHNQSKLPNPKNNYLDFYQTPEDGSRHLDGSSQTMYQDDLFDLIKKENVFPKFIFLLREPAERIRSSFYYTSNNLAAVEALNFDQYVDLLLADQHEKIRPFCKHERAFYSLSHELKFSRYHHYLERWKEVLGLDNMLIFTFDQLKKDQDLLWKDLLGFLGLAYEPLALHEKKRNPTRMVKYPKLHFWLHQVYERTGYHFPLAEPFKRLYGGLQFQSSAEDKNEASLQALKKYFRPWNEKLAADYHVEISQWM